MSSCPLCTCIPAFHKIQEKLSRIKVFGSESTWGNKLSPVENNCNVFFFSTTGVSIVTQEKCPLSVPRSPRVSCQRNHAWRSKSARRSNRCQKNPKLRAWRFRVQRVKTTPTRLRLTMPSRRLRGMSSIVSGHLLSRTVLTSLRQS